MKALKIGLISVASLLVLIYTGFLFIVPAFVKFNDYTYELKNESNNQQGLIVKLQDIRVVTTWTLSAGVKVGKINAYYQNGEKFLQADNINLTVSLPYFLIKKIKLDTISADKIIARLGIEKDGKFTIEKYIPTYESEEKTENVAFDLPFGLKFSDNMSNVDVKKYSLTFIDNTTDNPYSIKGANFKISDFILNKKIKIKTNGEITLNKRKQFGYDINFTSYVMPDFTLNGQSQSEQEQINIIDVFKSLYKLNLTADVNANIQLKGSLDDLKLFGNAVVNNLSANIQGKQLPASSINLDLKNNEIKVLSEIFTAQNENALINGYFKFGKKQFVDMNVKSDKLELANIFKIVNAVLPMFGIADINFVRANGQIKANFNIKSDFKTINSDGYLKVIDANIFYNAFNIALKNIQADIDFSSNQINIKQANANFNGAPLSLSGAINSNAYAEVSILADKIPLRGVIVALGQLQLLNDNNIKSGIVTLNGKIKGNLAKIVPQINVDIDNIDLYNKPTKTSVLLSKLKVDAKTNGIKVDGNALVSGLKIAMQGLPTFSVPNSKISFNEKDINLDSVYINLNNSKVDILGKITDYPTNKINVDITARGMLGASDIKSSLDKSIRNFVKASGRLPLIAKVSGNDKVLNVNGQILANNTNYLSLIDINSLSGKTSLINASLKVENNNLKINDISINALDRNSGITENFNANLSGASKVLYMKGSVNNLTSKTQQLSGINISIPNQITVEIPTLKDSQLQVKGELNVSGTSLKPQITGMVNVPYAKIPQYSTSAQNISLNITKNLIDIYCNQAKVADSTMNIVLTVNNNFDKGIYIRSMEFNASNLNADSLTSVIANFPQNEIAPGTNMALTIQNGKAKVERISSGNIVATNIVSDFNLTNNLFKLNNLNATAYGGKIAGTVTYNILYAITGINLQGRSLNAQSSMHACTGIKNLMTGFLDFDALNLTTRGLTDKQIMQSLRGNVKFQVTDGQMGTLGKLENLLYAQNILANNLLKTTLGAVAGAVKVKKTGEFKYIKGTVSLDNGWATLERIQTSGPAMSMYVKGKYNILNNTANLIILGRLSSEVVNVLGPIGNFSVNKLLSSIPKIGTVTSSLINQMTTNPSGENLGLLPELTPSQENTKEFKASINGSVESTNSVSYFKWLATPTAADENSTSSVNSQTQNSTQSQSVVTQQAQQAIQKAKTTTQNAINKVLNIPNATTPSTQNTTPSSGQNSSGVADFINNLPNLTR